MKKILSLFIIVCKSLIFSQTKPQAPLWDTEDSSALATIATLPDTLRSAALMACMNANLLIQCQSIQRSSSNIFRVMMSEYSRKDQQNLWDLSRYPSLIKSIAEKENQSKEELENISVKYPKELQPLILEYGKHHHHAIGKINALYDSTQEHFNAIMNDQPQEVQSAFRQIVNKPEVMNELTANIHLALTLGDRYKKSHDKTIKMLDSISEVSGKQKIADYNEWKGGLEKNPEAKKEMETAAMEFANESKLSNSYEDDVYGTVKKEVQSVRIYDSQPELSPYYVQPYPYWFNYPWWYDYPYWYPYPFWFHVGFYWGPSGIVWLGYPSPFFMHWYLYSPYHHYYYSHFTDYCLGYHIPSYGPRIQNSGFNGVIRNWSITNAKNLPRGYFNADPARSQRIKELGRFEMDYHNNTKGVFGNNISRTDFLKYNSQNYPKISPALSQPNVNAPIQYPRQQSPVRFNMMPSSGVRMGEFPAGTSKPSGGIRRK